MLGDMASDLQKEKKPFNAPMKFWKFSLELLDVENIAKLE